MSLIQNLFAYFIPVLFALSSGDQLPDISAKNQDGKSVQFSTLKGQFILIYFYPKDETPGCTKEACSLRDEYAKFKKLNTAIFGVSRQDGKSHQEFRNKHKLPFDLLVDLDGKLGQALGVGTIPGKDDLSLRQSLLIGPNGKILRTYPDVDPAKHATEIIADIENFNQKK